MSVVISGDGQSPRSAQHQHLYGRRVSTTSFNDGVSDYSGKPYSPYGSTPTTSIRRKSFVNLSRQSREKKRGNKPTFVGRNRGEVYEPGEPLYEVGGGRNYIADVHPAFCVEGSIRCVEAISEGTAWTAEYDGTIRIRSLPQGTIQKELEGRIETFCTSLLYVEAHKKVWVAFNDGYIRVYNATSDTMEAEFVQHAGGINCMTQIDNNVFTGGVDWKIGEWRADTNAFVRLYFGHGGGVRSLHAFEGPSGAVLFSASDDGTIKAWDPYSPIQTEENRSCVHTFEGHERSVLALETVAELSQLWSGGEDGTVRVWNLTTLEEIIVLQGHTAPVASLLAIESRMWSGDQHGHLILWDLQTFAPLQEISSKMNGARLGKVLTIKKIVPSSAWLVWTAGATGFVQCWSAGTTPILFTHQNEYKYVTQGDPEKIIELQEEIQQLHDELRAQKRMSKQYYDRGWSDAEREMQPKGGDSEECKALRQQLRDMADQHAQELARRRPSETKPERTPVIVQEHRGPVPAAMLPPGRQFAGKAESHTHEAFATADSHLSWRRVLAQRPHQLREAARQEICMALGMPPTQISDLCLNVVRSTARSDETESQLSSTLPGNDKTGGNQSLFEDDTDDPGVLCITIRCVYPATLSWTEAQQRLDACPFHLVRQVYRETETRRALVGLDAAEKRIQDLEEQLRELSSNREEGEEPVPLRVVAEPAPIIERDHEREWEVEREIERLKRENLRLREHGAEQEEAEEVLRRLLREKVMECEEKSTESLKVLLEDETFIEKKEEMSPADESLLQAKEEELLLAKDMVEYYKETVVEKEKQRRELEEQLEQLVRQLEHMDAISHQTGLRPQQGSSSYAAGDPEKGHLMGPSVLNQLFYNNSGINYSEATVENLRRLRSIIGSIQQRNEKNKQEVARLLAQVAKLRRDQAKEEDEETAANTRLVDEEGIVLASQRRSGWSRTGSRGYPEAIITGTAVGAPLTGLSRQAYTQPVTESSYRSSTASSEAQSVHGVGRLLKRDTLERPPYPNWARS